MNTRLDPAFWKDKTLRLFISHLAKHRSFAAELQTSLAQFGISGFVAHSDIEPTEEWQAAIETALNTCDALVALLHSDFHQSNWTDQEIGFAMGRRLPVSSVRLGQDPYGFIGRFQAFDGKNKTAELLARELFAAYRKNKQTQGKMADSLVRLFEESDNFALAKERVGYLEELEVWERSFSERISAAVKSNSQISNSFGVPSRVNILIRKWARKGVGSAQIPA